MKVRRSELPLGREVVVGVTKDLDPIYDTVVEVLEVGRPVWRWHVQLSDGRPAYIQWGEIDQRGTPVGMPIKPKGEKGSPTVVKAKRDALLGQFKIRSKGGVVGWVFTELPPGSVRGASLGEQPVHRK